MLVNGRSVGAPAVACEGGTDIIPGHVLFTPSTIAVPYSVNLSNIPSIGYIPRQTYNSKCYTV